MLTLPQHQRRGHGLEMLKSLYQDLVAPDIVEINVEDPSPNFTALRNRMDYELLQKNIDAVKKNDQSSHCILPLKNINAADDPLSCFLTLTENETVTAAQIVKITPNQIAIAYEIYKLSILEGVLKTDTNREEWEKQYRLMVKRRLLRFHKEELGGLKTKEERQQLLDYNFQKLLNQYRGITRPQQHTRKHESLKLERCEKK
mmetsp:Transcript_2057/g.3153  ORF Transcript_2057/g.3153 Transcript_2057/m.3153 type:complete len:202 (-) Transcript_2057:1498-2103(-)